MFLSLLKPLTSFAKMKSSKQVMRNGFVEIYRDMILGAGMIPTQIVYSLVFSFLLGSKKKKLWRILIEALCLYVFCVLFLVFIYSVFPELPYDKSLITYMGFPFLVATALYVVYTLIFDKANVNHQLTIASVCFSLFYSLLLFAGAWGTAQDYEWFLDTSFDFTMWFSLILFIVMAGVIYKFDIRKFDFFPSFSKYFGILYLALVLSLSCLLRIVVFPFYTGTETLKIWIYGIFMAFSFVIYIMFYRIGVEYQEKVNALVFFEEHKNDQHLLEMSKKNSENLRKIRHDLKNQVGVMKILLDERKYDELESYFGGYSDMVGKVFSYSTCGNSTVDNILNLEKSKIERSDIILETSIVVPKEIPIQDVDLCSLITNLLDNAFEAAEKVKDGSKTVSLKMETKGEYLFVVVRNPINKTPTKTLQTTKKDKKNHGFGVRIIKSITEKYNGTFDYEITDSMFVAKAMLLMRKEDRTEDGKE